MKKHNYSIASLALLSLIVSTSSLHAVTIFSDTFDVGATPTINNDLDDPNDTAWTAVSLITPSINTGDQFGSGNSLYGNIGGSTNLLKTTFAEQTLSQIGDSLSVTFDYKYVTTATDKERAPSFGFHDSDGGTSGSADGFEGYLARVDHNRIFLATEDGSNHNSLAGSDESVATFEYYATTGAENYDGSERQFTFTLTRVADTESDGYDDIRMTIAAIDATDSDNNMSLSYTDTITSADEDYEFDMFSIRSSLTPYYIDNIVITAIPEPASMALIGGCLALCAVMLRRREK